MTQRAKTIDFDCTPEIVRLYAELVALGKTSVVRAIEIGELLSQMKERLPHGRWLPWCKGALPFSERTARRYMKLGAYKDRVLDDLQNGHSDRFGLDHAYEIVAEIEGKSRKSEPKASKKQPIEAKELEPASDKPTPQSMAPDDTPEIVESTCSRKVEAAKLAIQKTPTENLLAIADFVWKRMSPEQRNKFQEKYTNARNRPVKIEDATIITMAG